MVVKKQPKADIAGERLFQASRTSCISVVESGRELFSEYRVKAATLFEELVLRGKQVQLDAQVRAKQLGEFPRSKLEDQWQQLLGCCTVLKDALRRPAKAASKA